MTTNSMKGACDNHKVASLPDIAILRAAEHGLMTLSDAQLDFGKDLDKVLSMCELGVRVDHEMALDMLEVIYDEDKQNELNEVIRQLGVIIEKTKGITIINNVK